jgi:hypothetical protein
MASDNKSSKSSINSAMFASMQNHGSDHSIGGNVNPLSIESPLDNPNMNQITEYSLEGILPKGSDNLMSSINQAFDKLAFSGLDAMQGLQEVNLSGGNRKMTNLKEALNANIPNIYSSKEGQSH